MAAESIEAPTTATPFTGAVDTTVFPWTIDPADTDTAPQASLVTAGSVVFEEDEPVSSDPPSRGALPVTDGNDLVIGQPIRLVDGATYTLPATPLTANDDGSDLLIEAVLPPGTTVTLPAVLSATDITNTTAKDMWHAWRSSDLGVNWIGGELAGLTTFNTVADLSASNELNGTVAKTRGYTTANDGGGAEYRLDTGSAATVDGGFVLTATTGRWIATDQTKINLLKWGCVKGTTDNAARLNAVFAAATMGNGAKYTEIFEANKPMLTHPDKIYPGQVLRIPQVAKA